MQINIFHIAPGSVYSINKANRIRNKIKIDVIIHHLYLRQIIVFKVLYGEVKAKNEVSGRLKYIIRMQLQLKTVNFILTLNFFILLRLF